MQWVWVSVLALALGTAACSSDDSAGGSGGSGNAGSGGSGASGGSAGTAGTGGQAASQPGDVEDFAVLDNGSEGIAFGQTPSGATILYVSMNTADRIVTVSETGQVSEFVSVKAPLGMAVTKDGDLLVCGKDDSSGTVEGVIWKVTPQGDASVFIRGDLEPFETTNFIAVAPDDKIVFSDSKSERVYLTDAAGENLAILSSEIKYPNGMAFSADGRQLFVASWNQESLWSIPRDPKIGNYGPGAEYLSGVKSVDGVLVMQAGDLMLITSGDGVVRADPNGSEIIADGSHFNIAANGAFGVGGYGSQWLYVTNLFGKKVSRVLFADGDTGLELPVR
ncbi:MAG: SMP-30/gluconolactonase/LRE family protein [Myxococcales bacterium]|nr:SMP-30/gluconolactonase/LRE family protein [Myxococcales bacterium]MCB9606716.1 SMP-30/gluconolactonase/LRE family protein [Polyangiaceae bacterium]